MNIEEIRKLCDEGAFKWTTQIVARLQERGIEPSDIRNCIKTGAIIEQYPDDYPHPSCLVFGNSLQGRALHTVVGVSSGFLWLVTAYHPTPDKWENDNMTRKE